MSRRKSSRREEESECVGGMGGGREGQWREIQKERERNDGRNPD